MGFADSLSLDGWHEKAVVNAEKTDVYNYSRAKKFILFAFATFLEGRAGCHNNILATANASAAAIPMQFPRCRASISIFATLLEWGDGRISM